jgi:ABC-type glycerol-3-phosphate transport system substrate-binding protein
MKINTLNKKLLIIILTFIISNCSKEQQSEKDVITLHIWETYKFQEHNEFMKIIEQFENEYFKKNNIKIKIKADRVPFDNIIENIKTAAQIKATPDIARLDAGKILELAFHKVLLPLDKLPNFKEKSIEEKGKNYLPAAYSSNVLSIKNKNGIWEEHLFGLPEQVTCLALFWNKKIFREAKSKLEAAGLDSNRPPKNWDEMIEYGKILTDPQKKQYAFGFSNNLWFTFPLFNVYKSAFSKLDKKTNKIYCDINSKNAIAALEKKIFLCTKKFNIKGIETTLEAGAWRSGAVGPDQGFNNEMYSMIFMGPWMINRFKDSNLEFGISLIPKPSKREAIELGLLSENADDVEYEKSITTSTNLGGNNLVIFKTCKGKKAEIAYDFLNYVTSKKIQLQWAKKLGQIPVNINAFNQLKNSDFFTNEEKIFMEQVYYAKPAPKLPRTKLLYEIANMEMERALKGSKTAKEALDTIAEKINKKILSLVNE